MPPYLTMTWDPKLPTLNLGPDLDNQFETWPRPENLTPNTGFRALCQELGFNLGSRVWSRGRGSKAGVRFWVGSGVRSEGRVSDQESRVRVGCRGCVSGQESWVETRPKSRIESWGWVSSWVSDSRLVLGSNPESGVEVRSWARSRELG